MTITIASGGVIISGTFYNNRNLFYTTQDNIPDTQFIDWAQIRAGPDIGLRIIVLSDDGQVAQVTEPIVEILEAKAA